jgi:hypothetical protein
MEVRMMMVKKNKLKIPSLWLFVSSYQNLFRRKLKKKSRKKLRKSRFKKNNQKEKKKTR